MKIEYKWLRAAADWLANSWEHGGGLKELSQIIRPKEVAKKLLDAWENLGAMEQFHLSISNTPDFINWIELQLGANDASGSSASKSSVG